MSRHSLIAVNLGKEKKRRRNGFGTCLRRRQGSPCPSAPPWECWRGITGFTCQLSWRAQPSSSMGSLPLLRNYPLRTAPDRETGGARGSLGLPSKQHFHCFHTGRPCGAEVNRGRLTGKPLSSIQISSRPTWPSGHCVWRGLIKSTNIPFQKTMAHKIKGEHIRN